MLAAPRAVVSNIIGVSAWTYQWHPSDEPGALEGIALTCVELLFNGLLTTPLTSGSVRDAD